MILREGVLCWRPGCCSKGDGVYIEGTDLRWGISVLLGAWDIQYFEEDGF